MKNEPTQEQKKILENKKKKLIVSASAGSGKTFVVIEYLINLICTQKIPLSKFLVLTFTKAAANEMKTRLYNAILEQKPTPFLLEQIDEIAQSDISTIDAFCEKLIKRNINKLDIDENFLILDEHGAEALKLVAFDRAFEIFYEKEREQFDLIYFAFKKNKEMIWKCVSDMRDFFDSNFEGDDLADEFEKTTDISKTKGEEFLSEYVSNALNCEKKKLEEITLLPDVYEVFRQKLLAFCNQNKGKSFIDFFANLNTYSWSSIPRNKMDDQEKRDALSSCKDKLTDIKKLVEKFDGLSEEEYEKSQKNNLSIALLQLYKLFSQTYQNLKHSKQALDFSDLERVAKELLQDEDIMKSLQEKYEYIFIDEYQDTNFLQEAIIKPIAQKGNFVAVGDPKQGIYGFRNASMEIMKKDIDEFSGKDNSDALFLTGNFRSDKRVLDFINKIFVKNMTLDGVGIDYEKTSMLKGLGSFEKGKLPSVCVDFIKKIKDDNAPSGDYSVKDADMSASQENRIEVQDIARRVNQILQNDIYDAKKKVFRKIRPNDIAILFRGRNNIMQEAVKVLQEEGYNVVADIKHDILDDGELRVLTCLLKLTYNFNDEISLVAVMNSWFGGFRLDEILALRNAYPQEPFYQIVRESEDEKIVKFKKDIDSLYFDCQVMGASKALNKLFAQKDFYSYLNTKPSPSSKKSHIDELFKIIKNGDFEFDIPSLIDYIQNSEGYDKPEGSADALTISTIHATKGLEYPIVILCGCGENLNKSDTRQYSLSKDFGLATNLFDFEDGEKWPSPSLVSSRLKKQKKDFIEEVMIFYVALTRAQNHLYLIGTGKQETIKVTDDVLECGDYFDLIFSAFGKDFVSNLFEKEQKKLEGEIEFNVIENVEKASSYEQEQSKNISKLINDNENILEYIDFNYNEKDKCKYQFKNSVTSVLHLEDDEVVFVNGEKSESRENAIKRGNAYHEALKVINFDLINSKEDLENQKEFLQKNMTENYFQFIDNNTLWNNIKIIKEIINGQKAIKEKQFIMETSLRESGISQGEQKVIIQGIVDLFSLGEKNILIDYKYTSETDENKLKERYGKQIYLYSLAIEKAFNKKIDEKYLLSLKFGKMIKIE